ncbi:hypothetical protein LP109_01690 [Moraxella bovis]|uniref:hypothetical protein n=1 Tax=Moraxella bovis TaxID=476 RepID=UPI000993FAB9|nr:hypothetical protein [Moraxella bovis]OOR86533.1 hypothetical protein B0182_13730 [Moraxella bovis]UZA17071.1 hypothetical protein LP109_01690 [Moraxella bovis]
MVTHHIFLLSILLTLLTLGCNGSYSEMIVSDSNNAKQNSESSVEKSSSHEYTRIKLKNSEHNKTLRNELGNKKFLIWQNEVKDECYSNNYSLGNNIGLEYEICYERLAVNMLKENNSKIIKKNSDDVIISSLPFDSKFYLNCVEAHNDICQDRIHFLTENELINYANILNYPHKHTIVLPTSKNGIMVLIYINSDKKDNIEHTISLIAINGFGIKKEINIEKDQYFILDEFYTIYIYSEKNDKLEKEIPLEGFL